MYFAVCSVCLLLQQTGIRPQSRLVGQSWGYLRLSCERREEKEMLFQISPPRFVGLWQIAGKELCLAELPCRRRVLPSPNATILLSFRGFELSPFQWVKDVGAQPMPQKPLTVEDTAVISPESESGACFPLAKCGVPLCEASLLNLPSPTIELFECHLQKESECLGNIKAG